MKWFRKPKALSLEDWDLWQVVTRRTHPLQYFLRVSVPDWFHRYVWGSQFASLTRLYDWIYFHLPKNRQHILSLQQSFGSFDDYKYGNLTINEAILYANFNLICKYSDFIGGYRLQMLLSIQKSEEDIQRLEVLEKLLGIKYYWRKERYLLLRGRDRALTYDDSLEVDNEIKQKDIQYLNEIVSLYPQLKKLGI